MSLIHQQKNEAFSIATLLYIRLRKMSSRVIDVMYLIDNKEYARYILGLAEEIGDKDLSKYANRLTILLELATTEEIAPILVKEQRNIHSEEPTEEEGGVSKSMLKKSRLDFDKIEKCE